MSPRAGGEKTHRGGFAVGSRDDGGGNVPQFIPRNIRGIRQRSERKTASTDARAQSQLRLIEHMRQRAAAAASSNARSLGCDFQSGKALQSAQTPRIPR